MGWQAAVVGLGVAQFQQQGAAGKYNQAVANRNATVAEQEAAQIEKQLEFDLARFDQQFSKFQGETKVALAMSGVERSGSGLRALRYNAEQSEIEKTLWITMLKLVNQENLKKQTLQEYKVTLLNNKQEWHNYKQYQILDKV